LAECITIGAVNYKPGSSRNYHTGSWRSMRPIIDENKCIKCGTCYIYCPDSSVVKTMDGKKIVGIKIDYDYCKGCGICAKECPKEAIDMIPEKK